MARNAEQQKAYDAFFAEYGVNPIDGLGDEQRRAVGVIHDTDKENYAQSQSIMFVRWLNTLPNDNKMVMGEVEQDKMEEIHQYYLQFRSAQFEQWRQQMAAKEAEKKSNLEVVKD